MTTSKHL